MHSLNPWLPKGFEFLSGLPELRRRRRQIMVIQVFVDESAQGVPIPPWFAMGGGMASAESWALLSDEWRKLLDKHPVMARFKYANFADKHTRRMEQKLLEFARLVDNHVMLGAGIIVDFPAYDNIVNTITSSHAETKHPYFVAAHLLIQKVTAALFDMGYRERYEIIFDRQRAYFPTFRQYYPAYLEMMEKENPSLASIMPIDPMPRASKEFLPLQVADLMVGLYRASAETPDERPFSWVHKQGFQKLREAPGPLFIERPYIESISGPLSIAMQEAQDRIDSDNAADIDCDDSEEQGD